jgi:signal peptidase I
MSDKYEEMSMEENDIAVSDAENESIEEDTEETEQDERGNRWAREVLSWIMIFVGAFVVAYILSNYVIVNAKVPSGSMISTINIDDKVIGFRLSYLFSDPERGDIVMFNAPDKENTIYIKRIIGVPGDTITISDNQLYINGELQEESYVKNGWTRSEGTTEYVVPEGEYFMMGDNRDNSSDSRVWGTVKKDDIIAKAIFRYYPSVKSLLK